MSCFIACTNDGIFAAASTGLLLRAGCSAPLEPNSIQFHLQGDVMTDVSLGNHTAVFAAKSDQGRIREFYCGVLGCLVRVASDDVDRFQLADTHFCFVYQDAALSEDDFLKSTYLELKSANVAQTREKILRFGVRQLDLPDSHLYFQAPGGQVFRVVGLDEDLSIYEGSMVTSPQQAPAAAG